VNIVLNRLGFESIPFLNDPKHWVFTYVFLGIWKNMGWNTIIYLAALTNINPELYEAASIDGSWSVSENKVHYFTGSTPLQLSRCLF